MCNWDKFLSMNKIILVNLFIVFIFLSGCEKDAEIEPKDYPYVIINSIDMQADEYITINAQIFYSGNLDFIDHGFIIQDLAFNKDFELSILESMGPMEKSQTYFSYTLKQGLIKNMRFSVRAFTETSNNIIYSNEKIFYSPIGIH